MDFHYSTLLVMELKDCEFNSLSLQHLRHLAPENPISILQVNKLRVKTGLTTQDHTANP